MKNDLFRVVCSLPIDTIEGVFLAMYTERGLAGIHFPTKHGTKHPGRTTPSGRIPEWHKTTTSALKSVLAGKTPSKLPPLDLSRGTAFQQQVWQAMAKIPTGRAVSYGDLAKSVGKPMAFRAVGRACGANPIPVLVPCHRVLAADSRLGGFSGGIEWKKKLLSRESVTFKAAR